jgi:hypothetical protein
VVTDTLNGSFPGATGSGRHHQASCDTFFTGTSSGAAPDTLVVY